MKPDEMKQFIQDAFKAIIVDTNATDETYSTYFSKDYIQYVDGKELNYKGFVQHMKALKAALYSATVSFRHIIAEDDKVSTVHVINAIKKDGRKVVAQVNALMQIEDEKIVLCDELTHIIHGDASDKDLGSRTQTPFYDANFVAAETGPSLAGAGPSEW